MNGLLHAEKLESDPAGGALDLHCNKGSVTVLTGPAADETRRWLEILAVLRPARSGRLQVLDYDSGSGDNQSVLRRQIGYVDADAPLLSTLDVRTNVTLPRLYHNREAELPARRFADELLDRLGYEGPRHEPPARLKPLERMQALLARALALDPPLVLINEPFDLDTVSSWQQLTESIQALAHDENRAVIVATRNLAFAAGHADQLVFIENGQPEVHADWPAFADASRPAGFLRRTPFAHEARAG